MIDKVFDFVAVDFETATVNLDSACAIGLAAVRDREIVETEYSLIKPPDMHFLRENIDIHGITPDMVVDSPEFDDLWNDRLRKYFGHSLVIAHNARFDMSVLKESLVYSDCPDFKYVDSVSIARDFVPGKKTLTNCAEHLGIDMGQHHNALDDAITCANIVLKCLELSRFGDIGHFCFSRDNIKIHHFSDLSAQKTIQKKGYMRKTYPVPGNIPILHPKPRAEVFNDHHPLYKKNIVFTGTFPVSRDEMIKMAVEAGAIVKSDVSAKVHYLVVGKPDPQYADENGRMKKERTAAELNDSGKAKIKIIDLQRFVRLYFGNDKELTAKEHWEKYIQEHSLLKG